MKKYISNAIVIAAIYAGETLSVLMLGRYPGRAEGWYVGLQSSPVDLILTAAFLCMMAPLLPRSPKTIMDHFLWWTVATVLIPVWVLAQWTYFFRAEVAWTGVWYASAGFAALLIVAKLLPDSRPQIAARVSPSTSVTGVVWVLVLGLGALALMVGLPDITNLSLNSIYVKRAAFMAALPASGLRIVDWINFVFAPLATILGLHYRRFGVVAIGVASAAAIYAWVGSKNSLVLIAAAICLYYLFLRRGRSALISFPGFLALLATVPAALAYAAGFNAPLYYVARRTLIVPSFTMLGHVQVGLEAGSGGDGLEWLYSAVTGLGSYDRSIYGSLPVGQLIRPGGQLNANSHFLSFPMMWGSLLPVLMVAILAVVVIWVMDYASNGADPAIAVPFGAAVAINLSDAYLLTALLAVGILLAIVVLRLLPRPRGDAGLPREAGAQVGAFRSSA